MLDDNKFFTEILLEASGHDPDFMRHLLSDRVSLSLTKVIEEECSPLDYTHQLLQHDYASLYQHFFAPHFPHLTLRNPFTKSLVFDRIITSAIVLRTSILRPHDIPEVIGFMIDAVPFLLQIDRPDIPGSRYSGLSHYANSAEAYIECNSKIFQCSDIQQLREVAYGVRDINDPSWILFDKGWRKTTSSPTRLRQLRTFLHFALVSYVIPDEMLLGWFDMDRFTIISLMDHFVELRHHPKAKTGDREEFLDRVAFYLHPTLSNHFFHTLFQGSFTDFKSYHYQNYGDRFQKPVE